MRRHYSMCEYGLAFRAIPIRNIDMIGELSHQEESFLRPGRLAKEPPGMMSTRL